MSKKPVTSGFVLGVIFNVNPKQTPRTTPAIENDSVVKGLVYRSHNQRVVFVRFLFPSRSPMEHECSEPKLSQARADIMSVIGADSFFLYADVNEIIVNRRVALHADQRFSARARLKRSADPRLISRPGPERSASK